MSISNHCSSRCLLQCVASPLASPSPQLTARSCQGGTSTSPVWQWAPRCRTWSGCWEQKTWRLRTTCPSVATSWNWLTCASPTITHVSPCRHLEWLRRWPRSLWKVGFCVMLYTVCAYGEGADVSLHFRVFVLTNFLIQHLFKLTITFYKKMVNNPYLQQSIDNNCHR